MFDQLISFMIFVLQLIVNLPAKCKQQEQESGDHVREDILPLPLSPLSLSLKCAEFAF